jgi:hypothetical protein
MSRINNPCKAKAFIQVNLPARLPRQVWLVKIEGMLVLLPKNWRKNNIFQRFIALKTKIKLQKTA